MHKDGQPHLSEQCFVAALQDTTQDDGELQIAAAARKQNAVDGEMMVEMQKIMSTTRAEDHSDRASERDRSGLSDRAGVPARRSWLGFIAVIQSILFLVHLFLYESWTLMPGEPSISGVFGKFVFGLLSVSFVTASLLAFRYTNPAVRALYKVSAVWLGLLNFLFLAAVASWIIVGLGWLAGLDLDFHRILEILSGVAVVLAIYGVINASWISITRVTVRLAKLPLSWRGRRAALISDLHLGHVRGAGFLRRVAAKIAKEKPDAIFLAGDLFDGTAIDAQQAAEPLKQLAAPQGVYFVAGNHEQFGNDSKYLNAVAAAGIRVLTNEKVEVDGLQIIGVPYRNATQRGHLASALHAIGLDRDRASILLTHAPDFPGISEAAGVSLQLSGHTHGGQFIPWSWLVRRIYGQFAYGLSRIGNLQLFTSSGAGTWGPPLRLGSKAEIVMLEFQRRFQSHAICIRSMDGALEGAAEPFVCSSARAAANAS